MRQSEDRKEGTDRSVQDRRKDWDCIPRVTQNCQDNVRRKMTE